MAIHLLISANNQAMSGFTDVFPSAKVIAFGQAVKTKAEVVWLWLDPLEQAKPQVEWLIQHYPSHKFVVMSHIPLANEAMACLGAGASAYVNVNAGPKTLKQIASVVIDGGVWLGEDLMQYLVLSLGKSRFDVTENHDLVWKKKLSQREVEVVEAVKQGASNKAAARILDITERTVKAHLSSIFEKLGVGDRLKLVLLVSGQ
jgi:DNA-binding NarL/FixJ family response regulator